MYPVAYDQASEVDRNRLTIFFRLLLVIPHFILATIGAVVVFFTLIASWIALVLTGRYPAGLYSFHSGVVRWSTRLIGYFYLVTDAFPPLDLGEHPEYPIRVPIAPAKESYSRAKALFRIILAIPVYVIAYVMQLWLYVVAIGLWFVGVITGRTSFVEVMRMPMAYYTRANAYYFLLTEDWPPFDPGKGELTTPPQPAAVSAPGAR